MFKKCTLIFALILFSLGIGKTVYFLKDGFSIRRIHALEKPISLGWTKNSEALLDQTFHYLGRGRQCFAFLSEDGQYVLKFPRTDIYKPPFWSKVLPFSKYREALKEAQKEREAFIRNSFLISYYDLKDETGLIALHLGKTPKSSRKLNLIDASGSKHTFPAYKTSFILQKRKPILMKEFEAYLKRGEKEKALAVLDALFEAISKRAKLGILNRDRSFLKNYGYENGTAYQIDIGSFFKAPLLSQYEAYEKSVRDSTDPVREWVESNYKELIPEIEKRINSILNN